MATGSVFLLYQNKPPKWKVFEYRKWKERIRKYKQNQKNKPLRY